MKEYTEAFKSKMVRKMLPPGAMTAKALAKETGVNQTSLSRWLKEARTIGVMDKPAKKWTPSEKLRVVIEAGRLDDAALGELLRGEGLHDAQLNEWRAAAEVSVRTKSEGLPRCLFAGRAASSGSPSLSTVWTWILEA